MANEDWKSILITLALSTLILNYFVNTKQENRAFEVSQTQIKYHANWTTSFDQLRNIDQLQQAYQIEGIPTLDLSFSMSSLKLEQIKKLLPLSFKQYETIKINVANNPIGTAGADYILSLIPNGVKQLQLEFDSIQADASLGQVLAKRLNNINSLTKLKLSLILTIKDDLLLDNYLRFSRIGQKLKNYELVLIGNNLNASSLNHLQSHLGRLNLQVLDLNLYANKIHADGAKLVAEAIKTQTNLRWLSLDLYFNNITEVGTEYICQGLDAIRTQQLKYINLNLDFNYIKNDGAKALGQFLSKLDQVQSLHLGVASKNFGYLGFKHIVNGLSKLLQLKELTFRCGINRVGVNGAEITRDLLYKLKNLTFLSLNFYENYVGDDGIIEITKAIVSLPQLNKLSVNFGFNDAKGFGLIRSLEQLAKRSFRELLIIFSSNQFQDTQVELIKDELSKLIRSTKRFQLQFMQTAISKKMKTELEELFSRISHSSGNKAAIRVNSVISDQKEAEYKKDSEERKKKLEEISKNKDSEAQQSQTEGKQQIKTEDVVSVQSTESVNTLQSSPQKTEQL